MHKIKSNRGFATILALLIVLVAIGGGWYVHQNNPEWYNSVYQLVTTTYTKLTPNPMSSAQPSTTQSSSNVYEVRTGELDLKNQKINNVDTLGGGHATFIIPTVADTGWEYIVVPFSFAVRPGSKPVQDQAYVQYAAGKFFPIKTDLTYDLATLQGTVTIGQNTFPIKVMPGSATMIGRENLEDLQKIPTFENFTRSLSARSPSNSPMQPEVPHAPPPLQFEKVTTGLGISVTGPYTRVTITPQEVLKDSRCPEDVLCATAGIVTVRTLVSDGYTTEAFDFTKAAVVKTPYGNIALMHVTPQRKSNQEIHKDDYQFTFTIQR